MTAPGDAAREIARAIEEDYSQFRAIAPIYDGSALIYMPGDKVPATNVKAHGYDEQGLVAKSTTKAAAAVVETPSGETKK